MAADLSAAASDPPCCVRQVFSLDTGKLQFWIDSDGSRLRRPAGLACSQDGCVLAVDLGNNCLKQYRYL